MGFDIKKVFANFAHGIAYGAKHFASGAKSLAHFIENSQAAQQDIELVTALVSPQAAKVEDLAFHVLGTVAHALESSADAVNAGGLNVSLDAQVKADIIAVKNQIKEALGSQLPKP